MTVKADEMEQIAEYLLEKAAALRASKGKEYTMRGSDGDDEADTLGNFYSTARDGGMTPLQAWFVHANKHWKAISNFVRTNGQTFSTETIVDCIIDEINYLLMLPALAADLRLVNWGEVMELYQVTQDERDEHEH